MIHERFNVVETLCYKKPHLVLALSTEGNPLVVEEQQVYHNLSEATTLTKYLLESKQLILLAKVINFLLYSMRFQVIISPKEFEKKYLAQHSKESDYGLFDLQEIATPQIQEDQFIFYVQEMSSGIPLKVICSLPNVTDQLKSDYRPLNYVAKR